jgi:hypothetical protein
MQTDKMVEHRISTEELFRMQWNDEFSSPCVIRVRPVVDKNSQPGEDATYLEEMGHMMMKDVKINGIDGIKRWVCRSNNRLTE